MIDATPLLVRSAGVKNYLYYWLDHLRRAAPAGDTIDTFPALPTLPALRHDASIAGRGRTVAGLAALALSNYTPLPVLDFCARRADLFHASVLVHRPPSRVRLTATIHDLTTFLMPELHPAANLRAERFFAELMRRADGLIAVSDSTRADAVRVLGLPPQKITVIHSGIADAFFDCTPESAEAVRRRYGLTRPFVLFIGTIEPRKNLDLLLDAFAALPGDLHREFDMAVAGPVGWHSAGTVERLRSVRYLGYIPEADLAPLTAAAAVFAYPSLYEGFGFPVAQAMAAGVPVLTSNVSSLPEIAGDAALLIDPRSLGELAAGLERLLASPDLRARLAAAGRIRANRFRWRHCAIQSLDFFRRIAG
ncbi:MAG: glycosyltransferase family 4 protein [Acidobacteriota bacterium]|nr:glycosyltransferase family 4 protein [Acidobacteriota bacterium]